MGSVLTIVEGASVGARYECQPYEVFVLGREALAQSGRGFPSDPYMSRRHVLFEVCGEQCRIEDLGSRNGVFVNERRVTSAALASGDVVKAGRTAVRFTVEAISAASSPAAPTAPPTAPRQATPIRPASPAPRPPPIRPPQSPPIVQPQQPPPRGKKRTLPLPPTETRMSGPRTRSGFEILDEIARGGLGVVYRAREKDTGHVVALKVLLDSREVDENARAHFVREMGILADLQHPNIVRTYNVGAEAGEAWISMEFIEGPTIEQALVAQGPLDARDTISVGVQLLRGIAYAHGKGFVHRDVKPANAMLMGQRGRLLAKIADFGLAKSLQTMGGAGLTVTGDAKGSPWFIAPEQLEDAKNIDYRADIYGLGATLYYAMTGLWHLHPEGKHQDFLANVIRFRYVPIGQRVRIPLGLARAIDASLARLPQDRPGSAQEFEQMLLQAAKGQ